jgi:hypothetical protein
MDKDSILYRIA